MHDPTVTWSFHLKYLPLSLLKSRHVLEDCSSASIKELQFIRLHLFNRAEAQSWLLLDSTSQMMEIGKKKKRAKGAQQLTGKFLPVLSISFTSRATSHPNLPANVSSQLIKSSKPSNPPLWPRSVWIRTILGGVANTMKIHGELVADYPEYRKLCTYQMKTLPLKRACPACAQWSMTVSWLSRWRYVIRSFRQSWMLGA